MYLYASVEELSEGGVGKLFVSSNGDTVLPNRDKLNEREINKMQSFIKQNYKDMYLKWAKYSAKGFTTNKVRINGQPSDMAWTLYKGDTRELRRLINNMFVILI